MNTRVVSDASGVISDVESNAISPGMSPLSFSLGPPTAAHPARLAEVPRHVQNSHHPPRDGHDFDFKIKIMILKSKS